MAPISISVVYVRVVHQIGRCVRSMENGICGLMRYSASIDANHVTNRDTERMRCPKYTSFMYSMSFDALFCG